MSDRRSLHPLARLSRPAAFLVVGVRFAVSLAFAVVPDRTMHGLFGVPTAALSAQGVAAHYAVRDAVLGAGLWQALRTRRGPRAWMMAGTVADLVDLTAIVATAGRKTRRTQRALLAQMTLVVLTDLAIAGTLEPGRRHAR